MSLKSIKVVMVGDCAWVGETIIHYAPDNIKYQHLKRTRSLYSKSFGIALKILRSKGDIYHVHYGLQDHFLVKLLKQKPTLCHFHGSDLRYAINGPYGWIVKKNLRTSDKVIVAVPDILEIAKNYRSDAKYIPNPVNIDLFKPMRIKENSNGLNVLFASALSFIKGAHLFFEQYAKYQKANPKSMLYIIKYGKDQNRMIKLLNSLNVKYKVLPPVLHQEMPSVYYNADAVVTDLQLGYLQMTSLEAMACYRPVIQYINKELYNKINMPLPPVMNIDNEEKVLEALHELTDPSLRENIARAQIEYIYKYHNPIEISRKIIDIYQELIMG
jgi:glycosyltransferase involved in cell wall biosynthesis